MGNRGQITQGTPVPGQRSEPSPPATIPMLKVKDPGIGMKLPQSPGARGGAVSDFAANIQGATRGTISSVYGDEPLNNDAVPPVVRLGLAALRDNRSRIELLEKLYPRAFVTDTGEGLAIWTLQELQGPDKDEQAKLIANRFGKDAVFQAGGKTRAVWPQLVNSPDVTWGDVAGHAPAAAKIIAGLLAKSPKGAAAVEGLADIAHSLAALGVERVSGIEGSIDARTSVEKAAGAAAFGLATAGAANAIARGAQALSPRNALARLGARESRGEKAAKLDDFEDLVDADGMPIPPDGSELHRAARAVTSGAKAIARGVKKAPREVLKAAMREPQLAGALEFGITDAAAVGPTAAKLIKIAQRHRIPVRGDEVLQSPTLDRFRDWLQFNDAGAVSGPFLRNARVQQRRFEQAFDDLLDGVPRTHKGAQQLGDDVAGIFNLVENRLADRLVQEVGPSINSAKSALGDAPVFVPQSVLTVIDDELAKILPGLDPGSAVVTRLKKLRGELVHTIPGAKKGLRPAQPGQRPGDRMPRQSDVPRALNVDHFTSLVTQIGKRVGPAAKRAFGDNSTEAKRVINRLYGAVQRDLAGAARHPAVNKEAHAALVSARKEYASVMDELREFRNSTLAGVVKKVRGAGGGQVAPAGESIMDRFAALKPSQLHETLGAIRGIDPQIADDMTAGLIQRYLDEALPGAEGFTVGKISKALGRNGDRLAVLMGTDRKSAMSDLALLGRAVARKNVQGSQTAQRQISEDLLSAVTSLFRGQYGEAVERVGGIVGKRYFAKVLANGRLRKGLIRSLGPATHRARGLRAAAHIAHNMRVWSNEDRQLEEQLEADQPDPDDVSIRDLF